MPILKLRQDHARNLPYAGKIPKQQCIYWDTALTGLGLRVYPTLKRVYVCSYRIQRRKRLAVLGRADVLSIDEARRKAVAYLGKVASNEDPQQDSDETREPIRFEKLCAEYIEGHAKKKKKTWKDDKSSLERLALPKLKRRLAISIVPADIEPIHASLGAEHPYAANRLLIIIRKMVNWAKVAGLLPKDYISPTAGIVKFRERARRRFITTAEMPRFLEALEKEDSEFARHAIWLLLLTGLRSNELLKAKWTDVDWDMGTLFVGLTKNGDPLLTPLSDAALAKLRTIHRLSGNPHIICGRKPGAHFRHLGPTLRRIIKRAGLENIRIHDLRRTVGSWLAQSGESLHLIGNVLNHRDPRTTAGYAYFQTQQRRDALTNHGDKVLTLGAPHVRPGAPSIVSAISLLPQTELDQHPQGQCSNVRHRHYFTREALYELVWTAPVAEVSRRLGVSDVALGKLCRRADVPTPGRGYWPRVEAGQIPARAALPRPPVGLPELLRIRGERSAPKERCLESENQPLERRCD